MSNNNSKLKYGLAGLAVLIGGTFLAALAADRFTKSRRRARSTVFYDEDEDDAFDVDAEEEVDFPDELDLNEESEIRSAQPTPRQRKAEYPRDEILLRFQRFIDWLEPTQTEHARYSSHQHTVTRRLETSLGATVLAVGSHARGTYLQRSSDLDLFAILAPESALWGGNRKTSGTVLNNLRQELEGRYRDTRIGKSGPSVTLHFGQGDFTVDVVPAVQIRASSQGTYEIPAAEGGWIRTNPIAHNDYLREQNDASGGKLRRISMLVKYWARCRKSISLHSFTAEMLLAQAGVCKGVKSYGQLLHGAFSRLLEYSEGLFPDPLGISDALALAPTDAKRRKLRNVLQTSLERLDKAIRAEEDGRITEALGHYQVVFNRNFPIKA